ncbi:MAG: hypothetical protein ABIS50_06660 [Luteolibacter sp.]|uniref:hypothetical protein n=1 Tax=Luteolibacter sp. TaxID=1962973 RepID=UPI003265A78F
MSHQHSDSCQHGHCHAKETGVLHLLKKWPLWIAVALMMIAMVVYVLTLNESEAPAVGGAPPVKTPAAEDSGTVRLEAPVNPDAETADANQRTRPLPKPPDAKHAKPVNPTAVAVEGRPGFVMSPFNDKVIDVRDIPPGTLVADPTYPPEEKKYFRTP